MFCLIKLILFLVCSQQQNIVVYKSDLEDYSKSVVIENKVGEIISLELDDLFFEIESPKDISFTYRVRNGRSIGSEFVSI